MTRQYKLARKMKKIKLTDAAKDLGVSQPTLSGWESETRSPSIDALLRMADYYGVTTDFLLGRATDMNAANVESGKPIPPKLLPALHGTPVYSKGNGWAFVDAVEGQLRFANGTILYFADAPELYDAVPRFPGVEGLPKALLSKGDLRSYSELWVVPISTDSKLWDELTGWYHVKDRFVENEVGQRFYFDFYEAKWLAFAAEDSEEE